MYAQYFGFREMPFRVTPDPRFFFTNPVYEEAYSTLLYGIREHKGFVTLTGEVGTGKTTLLHRLIRNLGPRTPFVFVFNTSVTFDELLTLICEELGLTPQGPSRLDKIRALNEFLMWQLRNGGTTALLIDEAQNLGDDVLEDLRLLSNLETPTEKLLQIVLVGQLELEAKLDQPKLRQLRQRIALRCQLDCLKAREVGAFIQQRLRGAGHERDDLFTPRAILRIARYSRGLPRLINVICDNALLVCYGASQRLVDAPIVDEVADDLRLAASDATEHGRAASLETALRRVEEKTTERSGPAARREAPRAVVALGAVFLLAVSTTVASFGPSAFYDGLRRFTSRALEAVDHAVEGARQSKDSLLEGWSVRASDSAGLRAPADDLVPEKAAPPAATPRPPIATAVRRSVARLLSRMTAKTVSTPAPPPAESQTRSEPSSSPVPILYPVPSGATVYAIAGAAYGPQCQIGLDLLEEANPGIADLDRVLPAQVLRLPPIDRETLVRSSADGSFQILIGSFGSLGSAAQFARQASAETGFQTRTVRRKVSGRVLLYRVEITDLASLSEVDRAWTAAVTRRLLPERRLPFSNEARTSTASPGACRASSRRDDDTARSPLAGRRTLWVKTS